VLLQITAARITSIFVSEEVFRVMLMEERERKITGMQDGKK